MSCSTVACILESKRFATELFDTKFEKATGGGGNYVVIKMRLLFSRSKILDCDVTACADLL